MVYFYFSPRDKKSSLLDECTKRINDGRITKFLYAKKIKF